MASSFKRGKTKPRSPKEKQKEEVVEEEEHKTAVCFLDPNSVRWMNKRRKRGTVLADGTFAASATKPLVTPSQAIYLGSIFRGLDYDNQGHISLAELGSAVRYVSKNSDGKVFSDPNKIIGFFKDMDIDGNGNVDLNEFLIGMTSQSGGGEDVMGSRKLQKSFSDFANLHRRRKIIAGLNGQNADGSSTKTELQKYKNLHKLFSIKYFNADHHAEDTHNTHGNIEAQIEAAKEDLKVYKRDISADYTKRKVVEGKLSRVASIYFEEERKKDCIASRTNNNESADCSYSSGLSPSKEANMHRHDYSIGKSITASGIPDGDNIAYKLERKINARLSEYPLLGGPQLSMHKTFTPSLDTVLKPSLSAPGLPTCFGHLTSLGGKIEVDVNDIGNGVNKAGTSSLQRRKEALYATSNFGLETRLTAQLLRTSSTPGFSLNNTMGRNTADTRKSTKNTFGGTGGSSNRGPPVILKPISTRDRIK